MINGIGAGGLPDLVMSNVLGGMFGTYQRTNVSWPMQARPVTGFNSLPLGDSISQGVDNVDAAIATALTKIGPNEHVTVVGLSAGSLVADEELRRLLTSPNAPDKSKLTFVVVADSSRIGFNKDRYDGILSYQYRAPVETKYDTIVVAAEYDGFADFPDRPMNFLAVANAIAGEIVTHVPSMFTDLSTVPAENITVTVNSLGGVTTHYFIPAAQLPLVQLLPFLAPQEAELRAKIDSAYIRNDGKSAAATPAVTVPAPAQVVNEAPAGVALGAPVEAPRVVAPAAPVASPSDTPAETVVSRDLAATEAVPAVVAPKANRGAAAVTEQAPRVTSHRGSAATRSDLSDPDLSGQGEQKTARPAAAARTANRPSA